MVKFANNSNQISTGDITLAVYNEASIGKAKINSANAGTLNVSEELNIEGKLIANSAEFQNFQAGDISISENIITLIDGSIYDDLIIKANNVTLTSDGATVDLAAITTNTLLIKDPTVSVGIQNTDFLTDRGIHFNYLNIESGSTVIKNGFIGYNPTDSRFRLLSNINNYVDNISYRDSSQRNQFDLGNLEIGNLLIRNITNNLDDNNINIIAEETITLDAQKMVNIAAVEDINITAVEDINIQSAGNINIKSTNNAKSVIIGNPDSKTIIRSNLEIEGTLDAQNFSFMNSKISTYADKNLMLNYDSVVQIVNITESIGTYTITFDEERENEDSYNTNEYIYIEGIVEGDNKFNGIHQITDVPDTTSVQIQLDTGLTIPSTFINIILGRISTEIQSNESGIIAVAYDEKFNLRQHKFLYDYYSTNYLDSSWYINRNLKTDNTILLKPQINNYMNQQDYTRLYVKDDGELYFKNSNGHDYKITNNYAESLIQLSSWSISNDEETVYSYNKIGINLSNSVEQFEVDGTARIRNNLQVDAQLKLGIGGAYLEIDSDNQIYYFDTSGIRHEITNDLMDIDSILPITNWNLANNEEIYTYNNVAIGSSEAKDFQLRVDGNVQITGKLDTTGDMTAGNLDATGSLSVNGFKSTNLNTQNLTIEDRNFQIGFIDVTLIDRVDEDNDIIYSRIDNNLTDNDYVFFQETNIYFSESGGSINGFRKINKIGNTAIKIYEDGSIVSIKSKTVNPARYIGYRGLSDDIIDNFDTEYNGTDEAVRVRIYITSPTTFKYSFNSGFSFINSDININADKSTIYYLSNTSGLSANQITSSENDELKIRIKFTKISDLSEGDYWEFDCCPKFIDIGELDEDGNPITATELNFLGEFGKILLREDILDSGLEIMMKDANNNLTTQKFSYSYNNNDSRWKLTDNLHIEGEIQLQTKKILPTILSDQVKFYLILVY